MLFEAFSARTSRNAASAERLAHVLPARSARRRACGIATIAGMILTRSASRITCGPFGIRLIGHRVDSMRLKCTFENKRQMELAPHWTDFPWRAKCKSCTICFGPVLFEWFSDSFEVVVCLSNTLLPVIVLSMCVNLTIENMECCNIV